MLQTRLQQRGAPTGAAPGPEQRRAGARESLTPQRQAGAACGAPSFPRLRPVQARGSLGTLTAPHLTLTAGTPSRAPPGRTRCRSPATQGGSGISSACSARRSRWGPASRLPRRRQRRPRGRALPVRAEVQVAAAAGGPQRDPADGAERAQRGGHGGT